MLHNSALDRDPFLNAAASQGVSPALMASTIKQMHELVDIAHQINGTACDTRTRLFGPWPMAGETAGSLREAPCGQAAELQEVVSRLRSVLTDTRENVANLAAGL